MPGIDLAMPWLRSILICFSIFIFLWGAAFLPSMLENKLRANYSACISPHNEQGGTDIEFYCIKKVHIEN